jgi:hypothetical protein
MEDYEVIEAAADYIEENGWCKRVLLNGYGQVCVDGALLAVTGHRLDEGTNAGWFFKPLYSDQQLSRVVYKLVSALGLSERLGYEELPHVRLYMWNDDIGKEENLTPEQDKQRVLDGLRKAAKIVRIEDENAAGYEV